MKYELVQYKIAASAIFSLRLISFSMVDSVLRDNLLEKAIFLKIINLLECWILPMALKV